MVSKMDRILLSGLTRINRWGRSEAGQTGFEYMMIVAAVSVAVIVAMIAIGPAALATAVCAKIKTVISTFPTC